MLAPPSNVDPARAADSSRYVGSPYHKDAPGFAGPPRSRPDANMCPQYLAKRRGLVEGWLREAIRAGHTGTWERGYPRCVWYRKGEAVYEARQGSPGSGEYHGYPLDPTEKVQGLP